MTMIPDTQELVKRLRAARWHGTEWHKLSHDAADALEALTLALQQERAWQPIETAPKDSKSRLVWCPENQCIYCASWGSYWIGERELHGWIVFGGGYRTQLNNVTHWQPLPTPPPIRPNDPGKTG